MTNEQYVLFLLKNYNTLKNERFFIQHEISCRGNRKISTRKNHYIALIQTKSEARMSSLSMEELKTDLALLERELETLDLALNTLSQQDRDLIKDLYVHKITWTRASQKWYLSEATISRKRRRILKQMGELFSDAIGPAGRAAIQAGRSRACGQ